MSQENELTEDILKRFEVTEPGALVENEKWWIDRQPALEKLGYMLRPRYRKGWVPSWEGTSRDHQEMEDGQRHAFEFNLDAIRTQDGAFVLLKKFSPSIGPHELDLNTYLSSSECSTNPHNHCAPLLDIVQLPNEDQKLMVFPLLRPFDDPPFETRGEVVAFITQIFEGVHFLHERNIAHRDISPNNIMMDASEMYPKPYHPVALDRRRDWRGAAAHYSRTRAPPRYHLIDLGMTRRYPDGPGRVLDAADPGADASAPEHASGAPPRCDPFAADVYHLGNVLRRTFLQVRTLTSSWLDGSQEYKNFGFIEALVGEMTGEDPARRPRMDEVVARFAEARRGMCAWELRARIVHRGESWHLKPWRTLSHWSRIAVDTFMRCAAIPDV
ncbi:kinase-like domain-containing protein [Gloeopeniophorella convolvens]|nr:kinase-like domain-containing protein [Gloeopeniophorella convolvens]